MQSKAELSHFSCLLLTVNLRGLLSSLFILSVGFAVFNPIKTVFCSLVSVFVYFMHVALVLMFYLFYRYGIAFKTIQRQHKKTNVNRIINDYVKH